MGDRANVFFAQQLSDDGQRYHGVGVYAHWAGPSLARTTIAAIKRGNVRLVDDPAYGTRTLVQRVMAELFDPATETGGGLWCDAHGPSDNSYPILVVNLVTGRAYVTSDDDWYCNYDAHDARYGVPLTDHDALNALAWQCQ